MTVFVHAIYYHAQKPSYKIMTVKSVVFAKQAQNSHFPARGENRKTTDNSLKALFLKISLKVPT